MQELDTSYNRGVVRPVQCVREGWLLIKDKYWLILGIDLVGLLIGSTFQLVLMGPMMCGIYLCHLRHMRGRDVQFSDLFLGFNYFLPSFVAMLLMAIPTVVLFILYYVGLFASIFALIGVQGDRPGDEQVALFFIALGTIIALFVGGMWFLHLLTTFTFALIVDRRVPAWTAIWMSCLGVLNNLGGMICLMILQVAISFVGLLACYVGAIFVMPLNFASTAVAYRAIFPAGALPGEEWKGDNDEDEDDEDDEDDDEPRRARVTPDDEGVQEGLPRPQPPREDGVQEGFPQ